LSACCVRPARRGFTLVESVAATAIVFILLIGLTGMFSRGVAGFKQSQLLTFAENLSEFQAEDLKAMAPSVLNLLVEGTYPDPTLLGKIPPSPLVVYSNYPADTSVSASMYDSGEVPTAMNAMGMTRLVRSPWVAGAGVMTEPPKPSNTDVLLGANIIVETYEDLDDSFATLGWYYNLKLLQLKYPDFSKRIVVTRYDASSLPAKDDPSYHPATVMFDYTITVSHQQGGTRRVLYSTSGTVSYPYSNQETQMSLVSPVGGEDYAAGSSQTVTWKTSGDAAPIATYAVWISVNGGASYTSLGTVAWPAQQLSVTMPLAGSSQCLVTVNALGPGGALYVADSSDNMFTLH
jgi:hypothetical protein